MYDKNAKLTAQSRYAEHFRVSRQKLEAAMDKCLERIEKNAEKFGDKLINTTSGWNLSDIDGKSNNIYIPTTKVTWTGGLWTGMCLLAYSYSGNEFLRRTALSHMPIYAETFEKRIHLDDHDTGFKYTPSCVAAYKIAGDAKARDIALGAADIMLEYYCHEQQFIIRTGDGSDKYKYVDFRTLVDSMLNIPLFFWAYEETGDKKYYDAAVGHYRTTAKYLIRSDGSSYHHYQFDPITKEPVCGKTLQGFSDESCWTRGHSWLVYGYPVAFKYTHDEEIIGIHKAVSYYFINNLPSDLIPYWDFEFGDGSFEPRDSSAAAIAVCGLLEMCKYLPDSSEQKVIYENAAHKILDSLIDTCADTSGISDGLLLHTTGSKPHNMNIDGIATYADYFYLEALVRLLKPETEMFW